MKFGSVPASAGGLLTIHPLAPGSFERRHLGGGVLVVGGHSGVANQHCTKVSRIELLMQYLFATRESQQNRSFAQPADRYEITVEYRFAEHYATLRENH